MKLFKVMYADKLDHDTYYRVGDDNDTQESIELKEEKRFKIFMESIDEGIRLDRVYFVSEVNEIDGYEIIVGKKKEE